MPIIDILGTAFIAAITTFILTGIFLKRGPAGPKGDAGTPSSPRIDELIQTNNQYLARERAGVALLAEASVLLRGYELHHRNKANDMLHNCLAREDTLKKAEVNNDFATRIDRHLLKRYDANHWN